MATKNMIGRSLLLSWSVISVGLGVLSLRPAPSMFLLKLKVVVTEYGYVLAALQCIGLFMTRRLRSNTGKGFRELALASILAGSLCTAAPLLHAIIYTRDLPRRFEAAFGACSVRPHSGKVFAPHRFLTPWPVSSRSAEQIVFARTVDYELTLDLYRPPDPQPGGDPCVVVVHGGSWIQGSSRDFASLSPYLATQGYVVAGINYRKAHKHPFPAARDDLHAAIDHLKDNASEFGVDKDRIALLGCSAGGQLALLVAYEREDPAIRGVVSFYGPTDMVYGFNDPTDPRVIDTPATLGIYLRGTPDTAKHAYEASSPINFVRECSPPTLLLHGTSDEMVHVVQSDRLSQRLENHGVEHLYLRLPWATHGFDHNLWGPGGQISTYAVERFMDRMLKG